MFTDIPILSLCSLTVFPHQARKTLLAASPQNEESLTTIESAAIIVALDDSKPVTREEASWGMWVGDGRNRFYDKHQCKPFNNLVVTADILMIYFGCSHHIR